VFAATATPFAARWSARLLTQFISVASLASLLSCLLAGHLRQDARRGLLALRNEVVD